MQTIKMILIETIVALDCYLLAQCGNDRTRVSELIAFTYILCFG